MNAAAEVQTRLEKLRQSVNRLDASALLVTTPANVRYLSRFSSPDDGAVLVTATGATLLTDARYKAQAAEEAS